MIWRKSLLWMTLLAAGVTGFPAVTGTPAQELWTGLVPAKHHAPFYLKDGDRVVFYGDSITEQHLYTTYIESYCVTRFPKMHFTFTNSGWGGDRVTGGGGGPIDVRLQRDVLAYKPTVVTICLGMNDGGYRPFDPGLFATYVSGYRHILDTLLRQLPGVRITLLTPPAYDDVTRDPAFPGGYNGTLLAYSEAVSELGREYRLVVADTNTPLVGLLAKAETRDKELAPKIIPDRVHPSPGGHLVMAAAVLKAWNAPDTVADIAIDARNGRVLRQENTHLADLRTATDGVSFSHTDDALSWPLDRDPKANPAMTLALEWTDNEPALDHFMLTVTHLQDGNYTLRVDTHDMGTFSSADLARGVDLAALPDLPSNRQAQEVLDLTRQHNQLHFRRWREVQVPHTTNGAVDAATQHAMDNLDAQAAEAVRKQRDAAQPYSHQVELVRT
ncbi:MAG TPA: SGNH/GDSL hydrolase family protein [Chthonomonadaceae bacterium]|nr:SGNH/GDSL hydrolase family protein [Chthonomonadaceae bacterium]